MTISIDTIDPSDRSRKTKWTLLFNSSGRLRLQAFTNWVATPGIHGEWDKVETRTFGDRPCDMPEIPEEVLTHAKRHLAAMVKNITEVC